MTTARLGMDPPTLPDLDSATQVSREEFEAMAQHLLQSKKFRDPITTLFRVGCGYGKALADGKLSCQQFIHLCINTKVCAARGEGEEDFKGALAEILREAEIREDPTESDLRDVVTRFGQDGSPSPRNGDGRPRSEGDDASPTSPVYFASEDGGGSTVSGTAGRRASVMSVGSGLGLGPDATDKEREQALLPQ